MFDRSSNTVQAKAEYTVIPCRVFSPGIHLNVSSTLIGQYLPKCFKAATQLLGPYPFRRLDVLLVPDSFASLGMAR